MRAAKLQLLHWSTPEVSIFCRSWNFHHHFSQKNMSQLIYRAHLLLSLNTMRQLIQPCLFKRERTKWKQMMISKWWFIVLKPTVSLCFSYMIQNVNHQVKEKKDVLCIHRWCRTEVYVLGLPKYLVKLCSLIYFKFCSPYSLIWCIQYIVTNRHIQLIYTLQHPGDPFINR